MRSALIVVLALLLVACGDIGDEEAGAPDAPDDTEEDEVAEDPIDAAPDDPTDDDPGEPPEQVYPEDHDEGDRERRAPEGDEPGKVTGTLGGSAQLEGGCVWIDTGSGRYEVEWPAGYRAETDPVRLLRDGEVVAAAGDRLTVHGSVQADAMTICQVGPLFRATKVDVGQ